MRPYEDRDAEFPKVLYKYRCWSDQEGHAFHKRLLTDGEIYFAEPESFNDPFDCQIAVRFDRSSAADKRRILKQAYQHMYPEMLSKARNALVTKRVLNLQNPIYVKNEIERHRREINQSFGLFCLTTLPGSLAMWAHYADSHNGICVGLDTSKLHEFSEDLFCNKGILSDLVKVNYCQDYPIVDLFEEYRPDKTIDVIDTVLRTKSSKDWVYEDEYRFFITQKNLNKRDYALPYEVITEVIFGCKMEDIHKEEIKTVLRAKGAKIKLLQAKLKDYSFGLDFEQVDY